VQKQTVKRKNRPSFQNGKTSLRSFTRAAEAERMKLDERSFRYKENKPVSGDEVHNIAAADASMNYSAIENSVVRLRSDSEDLADRKFAAAA